MPGGNSRDPEKRARSLANLTKPTPAPKGNQYTVRHGAYQRIAQEELDAKTLELFDALGQDMPVRAPDGGLPRHDTVIVKQLAEAMIRRERVRTTEAADGFEVTSGPNRGKLRGVVEFGLQLDRLILSYLQELGATPRSRAALGLDLARAHRTLEDEIAESAGAWDAIDSTASDEQADDA